MKAKERQELFSHMSNEHGLHLLENELDEIGRIVGDKREYAKSNCNCKDKTRATTEWVCEHCGRVQK